jgi:hypothetical protein
MIAARIAGILAALAFSVAAMADTREYRDPNYDYFVAGDPVLPRAGHTQLILALMGAPSQSDPTMAQMQWHRRVLIVSTPGDEDPQFIAQQLALSQWTGGEDRDLSIVRIEGDSVSGSSETAAALRARYRLAATTFSVALVGKDGHVAVHSQVPLTGARLQAEIDAMPMRKAGQR